MRRAGHIRERAPGSWELRYPIGADPTTGKRRIATTTVRGTRKKAERELRRLLLALDTGEHVDPTRITVKEWLETWLGASRQEVAPKTFERYDEVVHNYLIPAFGSLQLAKLAPVHIQKTYNAWATGGRLDGKPGGLSPQTRRHYHRILRSALARAVEQQLIGRHPCDAFRKPLPRVERRDMAVLTTEQSARLLEGIRQHRVYKAVLLALAGGLRRGEILGARWRHVDFDAGTLQVVESLERRGAERGSSHRRTARPGRSLCRLMPSRNCVD